MKKVLILGMALVVLSGCNRFFGRRNNKGKSETTGWDISDPAGMFNAKTRYDVQRTGPGLVFIEGGSFMMGRTKEDVMHDWNNTPRRQEVRSFYMDETEVTNIAYREYLNWLKKVFPPKDKKFSKVWSSALPDNTVWRTKYSYNEVYVKNYLYHPAYNYYPVVGVNWLQANRYAAWRTDRVNERILIKMGYITKQKPDEVYGAKHFSTEAYLNKAPEQKAMAQEAGAGEATPASGSPRRGRKVKSGFVSRTDGILLPDYRLPTEVEWEYAAVVPSQKRIYNIRKGRESPLLHLRDKRIGRKGDFLANFKRRTGDYSGIAGWSNDGSATPCETRKFPPNDAGLYGMRGNVAEWVADRYEPVIDEQASDFNYYRGNTFTKVMREDGKTAVISEKVSYDTLPNGKLVYHNLPGQVLYKKLPDKDSYSVNSTAVPEEGANTPTAQAPAEGESTTPEEASGTAGEETAPGEATAGEGAASEETTAGEGAAPEEASTTAGQPAERNDVLRVIKGGSWRDRAYWLDPAERRFMREDSATSWIGFRCAMDRVGESTKGRTRTN